VVLLDDAADVGAVNQRRLVAVNCDRTSGFEIIHGLLNRVMEVLRVPLVGDTDPDAARQAARYGGGYEWKAEDSPTFFPGRAAAIYARGRRVGAFGVVHPEVLAAFDIPYPVAALELELEEFCFDQFYGKLPTHMEPLEVVAMNGDA
jgi:phenylalanyl-tRNA synthetase beta chain